MPSLFLFFSTPSSSSLSTPRRFLHQPFFPLNSSPPPPPPPQLPFSASPFFPPPPPPPASSASFPANISSLVLPHSQTSKPSSGKLLALAISAVISVILVLAVLVFYYCRRRRNHAFSDDKTCRSNATNGSSAGNAQTTGGGNRNKLRASSTSSEALYLGTLVNSHNIDEPSSNNGLATMDRRKLESPELRPLPPLNSFRQNNEGESTVDDEEEQFYSPRGSLGAAALNGVVDVFDAKSSDSSSSSSTSSNYGSVSVSPPGTPTPRPKFPGSPSALLAYPPQQTPSSAAVPQSVASSCTDESPRIWLDLENNIQYSCSTTPIKNSERPLRSPSLSPARVLRVSDQAISGSLENGRNVENSNDLDRKMEYLSIPSSGFSSPQRVYDEADRNVGSSSSSSGSVSPERVTEKTQSPDFSIDLDQNVKVTSLFSTNTTPERIDMNQILSPTASNVTDLSASSPECGLRNSPDVPLGELRREMSLNERISSVLNLELPVAVSSPPRAPPPPPPPPPLIPQTIWESPAELTPTGQTIPRPPALVPPSRPFVLQTTPMKVSPMELPPSSSMDERVDDAPKPKLKPLHWDKVRASSDREMVWDQLRSSSFKLNEEMIETLFIVNTPNPKLKDLTPRSVLPSPNSENRVLDPKKAQNVAILLRALNVTIDEVCDGLLEGNTDMLGTELLESLLKMAPTKEEERKLKEYKDDSPTKIGHAEKFLKAVLDVPFAFKRVNAMFYIANFESEVDYLKSSFETLEAACEELRSSRMFFKLLEAVLKTGNRMNVGTNRGDAHAFKLDTLLKLVDVKGADGKTTLLHFVVQEIIRSEGARLSGTNQCEDLKCRKLGLQVVSGLSSELTNVKKSAAMDSESLTSEVSKLSRGIETIIEVMRLNETMGSGESSVKFSESMISFMKMAEEEIIRIQAQESVAMSFVKEITEYFHGNSAREEAHPFRIFMVVRDFLGILDRVCKEVGTINERTTVSSAHKFPVPVNPTLPQVFSAASSARNQYSSSDHESASS